MVGRRAAAAFQTYGALIAAMIAVAVIGPMAVFDKETQEVYSDDPKIIVGGASVKAEIIEAESELQAVKEKIESIDALLNKAIEQL